MRFFVGFQSVVKQRYISPHNLIRKTLVRNDTCSLPRMHGIKPVPRHISHFIAKDPCRINHHLRAYLATVGHYALYFTFLRLHAGNSRFKQYRGSVHYGIFGKRDRKSVRTDRPRFREKQRKFHLFAYIGKFPPHFFLPYVSESSYPVPSDSYP